MKRANPGNKAGKTCHNYILGYGKKLLNAQSNVSTLTLPTLQGLTKMRVIFETARLRDRQVATLSKISLALQKKIEAVQHLYQFFKHHSLELQCSVQSY